MSEDRHRTFRSVGLRALFGALAGVAVVAVGATAARLWEDLATLQSSPADNVQWTFAQIEVDLLQLRIAAEAVDAGGAPAALRTRFDLFYSRIRTLERGSVFAELRSDREVASKVRRISSFLESAVGRIDGPDDALVAAAAGLSAEASALEATARELSLAGVRFFAARSDERRARFKLTLMTAAALAAALILALLVSLLAIERQRGVSTRRAAAAERIGRRLSATVGAALDAVIVADAAGRIIDWNHAATRIFGIGRQDAIGRRMEDLIVPERHRAAHGAGMKRFLETGERRVIDAGRLELSALRADGREFPVEIAVGASEGEDGPIFVSYLRDISDRQAAERELRDALDAAMAADRAKSGFIAVMSHEMRTPLNGVIGLIDLLRKTELGEWQRRLVESAAVAGDILLRQVNDVLEIARAEAGRLTLAEEPVDPVALLREAIEVTRPVAEANGDEVRLSVTGDFGGLIGDARRIRQIALNLLGNAVKFTRGGRVDVTLRVLERTEAGASIELAVEDEGPGVPEADRERIFEDFVMLDSSYEREAQGSGLGLAIVRRVAQAMGGSAWMEPAASGGSRFLVRFGLSVAGEDGAPGPPPELPCAGAGAARPLDVLLVEDSALNRMVFAAMLAAAGHRVTEAENGMAGVEAAERARFDAILMDISMPVLNGVDAARAIRAGAGPNRTTPIVGLTAHALPEELARFVEAGIATCVTKPLRSGDLERALAALAPPGPAGDAPPPLFDEDRLAELAATLDPARLARTIRKACDELEVGHAALVAGEDGGEGRRALAHRLAGAAALVGAERARAALSALETALVRGQETDERAALAALASALPATLLALREFAAAPDDSPG